MPGHQASLFSRVSPPAAPSALSRSSAIRISATISWLAPQSLLWAAGDRRGIWMRNWAADRYRWMEFVMCRLRWLCPRSQHEALVSNFARVLSAVKEIHIQVIRAAIPRHNGRAGPSMEQTRHFDSMCVSDCFEAVGDFPDGKSRPHPFLARHLVVLVQSTERSAYARVAGLALPQWLGPSMIFPQRLFCSLAGGMPSCCHFIVWGLQTSSRDLLLTRARSGSSLVSLRGAIRSAPRRHAHISRLDR